MRPAGACRHVAIGSLLAVHLADAQSVDVHGYADAALVASAETESWRDGGFGKLAWGGTGTARRTDLQSDAAVLELSASLPFDLNLLGDARYSPRQKSGVDVIDAFLSWHPTSAPDGWGWSAKIGAFLPPFGLENSDIGWSSPWTVTNSALASWVGEELKTVGVAPSLRHKIGPAAIEISGAAFGWNDVAGIMLADRGWDVGGQPLGLFDHLRLPDVRARADGGAPPAYTPEFRATDNQPGWYAGLSAAAPGLGKLQLFHYDNGATLGTERDNIRAWRTRFWDVGYSLGIGPFSIIAEGLSGNTMISPSREGPFTTDFYVASLLGSWTDDPWRCTLRVEQFGTAGGFGEHGREGTLSANWSPLDWLRTTIELVVVESDRPERRLAGAPAHAIETQPLAAIRATF